MKKCRLIDPLGYKNLKQYKFVQTVFFVSGNEEGLINKVQNVILNNLKSLLVLMVWELKLKLLIH